MTQPTTTPFLDRQAPLPKRATPAGPVWLTIGFAIATILAFNLLPVGNVVSEWVNRPNLLFRGSLFFLIALAVYLLVALIHELGHLAGGLLAGFTFRHIRVSVLMFNHANRVSFVPDLNRLLTGETRFWPPKDDARGRYVAMVMAGPLANLVTGILFFLVSNEIGMFVVISLVVGVSDLFPMATRLFLSDGLRLRMLFFDRPRGDRWIAICRLAADSEDGTRPQKMSPHHIATAIAVRDESMDTVTAHALAYEAAMSQQSFARAGELLDVCLQYSAYASPEVRTALASDAATYHASVRDLDVARQWLNDLPPNVKPWWRVRAETAIQEASGDRPGAWRRLDDFEKTLVSSGGEPHVLDFVRRWKSAMESVTSTGEAHCAEP